MTGVTGSSSLIPQWGDATAMFSLSQILVQQAEALVTRLADQSWYQPITITPNFPDFAPPPIISTPAVPQLEAVTWTTPALPAPFSILPPDLTKLFPGPFQGVQPTLNFGSAPQPSFGSVPASPPINLNYTYPVPSVSIPDAPTLLTLDVVDFTPFDIPLFTDPVPTLTLAQPNVIPFSEGWTYTSNMLTTIQSEIDEALTTDTDIGLSASVQQAMWDAAREREYQAQAAALADLDRMESLGYALPPGAYVDARLKIQLDTNFRMTGLSRDIMIKQAEMRLQHVTDIRGQAIQLEGILITYANNVQQRAFETAKYETEAALSIYNAGVQAYSARIEGFKATIQAYSAYIEGIKARISQLQAEIEFEQVKASINTALVEQYKAMVQADELVLEVAKVQVEIIQTQANIEKTKVDVYGAQVSAFVATVNSFTAEVEAYKANAEAQGAMEAAYRTSVEAYTAQVQAGTAQAGAFVEEYKAQVQFYEAQLDAFKAQLQAMVEQARAASEYNQSVTAEYTALVNATAEYDRTLTAQWQAIINEQLQVTEVAVKEAEANAQLQISQRNLSIEAIRGAAQVMAQLGAAALGAIHWSNTSGWNLSQSIATSVSNATSTSENHNFNETV